MSSRVLRRLQRRGPHSVLRRDPSHFLKLGRSPGSSRSRNWWYRRVPMHRGPLSRRRPSRYRSRARRRAPSHSRLLRFSHSNRRSGRSPRPSRSMRPAPSPPLLRRWRRPPPAHRRGHRRCRHQSPRHKPNPKFARSRRPSRNTKPAPIRVHPRQWRWRQRWLLPHGRRQRRDRIRPPSRLCPLRRNKRTSTRTRSCAASPTRFRAF